MLRLRFSLGGRALNQHAKKEANKLAPSSVQNLFIRDTAAYLIKSSTNLGNTNAALCKRGV